MNISEIAKLAGVSSAAVSRYFNNGYISEEKKEAIRKVVEQTGYRPSIQAQTLRTKKTKMIGVIVPKIASASIGKIVEGVLSVLNESGYQMLLAVTQNDPKKELEYLSQQLPLIITQQIYKHAQIAPPQQCEMDEDYHIMLDLLVKILVKI